LAVTVPSSTGKGRLEQLCQGLPDNQLARGSEMPFAAESVHNMHACHTVSSCL